MLERRYVTIPGNRTHELPPLLVHSGGHTPIMDGGELASAMVEAEEMLPPSDAQPDALEERKLELALQLKEQYRGLLAHWQWGDSVLEWIRQCEITFEGQEALRRLLHPDLWPHASRSSFVTLLIDKRVAGEAAALEQSVGLRLTFRQPPPIDCFSSQFLVYLNSSVATTAYMTWSGLSDGSAAFPPDRFHFEVLDLDRG